MKSAIKLLLSTTALTSGLLFTSMNEATACSHLKNLGASDATNFPSLNLDQLDQFDWKKVGAIAATSMAAVTAGVFVARQGEQEKQETEATQNNDVFEVSSFPIPVTPDAVASPETETENDDQLTPVG